MNNHSNDFEINIPSKDTLVAMAHLDNLAKFEKTMFDWHEGDIGTVDISAETSAYRMAVQGLANSRPVDLAKAIKATHFLKLAWVIKALASHSRHVADVADGLGDTDCLDLEIRFAPIDPDEAITSNPDLNPACPF